MLVVEKPACRSRQTADCRIRVNVNHDRYRHSRNRNNHIIVVALTAACAQYHVEKRHSWFIPCRIEIETWPLFCSFCRLGYPPALISQAQLAAAVTGRLALVGQANNSRERGSRQGASGQIMAAELDSTPRIIRRCMVWCKATKFQFANDRILLMRCFSFS